MFDSDNVAILAGSSGTEFADRMCRYMTERSGKPVRICSSHVIRFSEGNTFVRINESIRDRDVYVIEPIALNANDEFVEALFWLDALKRASALSATLVMPYFGYAKGDKKDEPRVSIRARVCADCLELSGADRFMTMDLHAQQVQGFFKKPMDHLYAMPMLCEVIRRMAVQDAVIVSPDAGYAKQARKFADMLNLPVAIGDKRRTDHSENAEVMEILGDIKRRNCIVVDDFTISGGTLVNLAQSLIERGAKSVRALLSHNIISPQGVKKVEDSPILEVVSTDTVSNPNIVGHDKFKTVSVAPMFAETLMRYYNHQSINALFDSRLPEFIVEAALKMGSANILS